MKKIYSLLIFVVLSLRVISQDNIIMKNGDEVKAKITEVTTTEIKYKKWDYQDGPTFTVLKNNVFIIQYQDGNKTVFNENESAPAPVRKKSIDTDSISTKFCKNFVGIDVGQFASISLGMIYERTFGKKGMFAIRIPITVGIRQNNDRYRDYSYSPYSYFSSYPTGRIFETGMDFLFFPTGQGKFKFYVAPYFEWGMYRYVKYTQTHDIVNGYPVYKEHYDYRTDGQHFAGGIKWGLLYQPKRHFSISADFGVGIKKEEKKNYFRESINPHLKANVIIGYRF